MTAPAGGAQVQGVVRRWIVFAILFVLVVTAASGLSDLLSRVLELRADAWNEYGLAGSLASAVIATPLAVLVWWFSWRRQSATDRVSVAWGLYVAAMHTYALVVFSIAALRAAAEAIVGSWSPGDAASAIVWFLVWVLHALLSAHRTRGPLTLATLPVVLGSAWGLLLASVGAILTLHRLLDRAFDVPTMGEIGVGLSWWSTLAASFVWCVGGLVIWWGHWYVRAGRTLRGGFADVALLVTGVLAPAAAALIGLGMILHVALRFVIDRDASVASVLDPLPWGISAAAVGTLVALGHRPLLAGRQERTRSAARLILAGLGLAGLAAGLGVVINSLLSTASTPLAGSDAARLLSAGLAALIVGGVTWVFAWQPHRTSPTADPARRIYLVVIFGGAAIVALVALLVIGSRVFEVVIGDGGDMTDRVRAPLGLLLAAALVAAYHFAVWRREPKAPVTAAVSGPLTHVVLVAGESADALARAIREATGARVEVWPRADAAVAASADDALSALDGVTAPRVLLVTDADGDTTAIPLAR